TGATGTILTRISPLELSGHIPWGRGGTGTSARFLSLPLASGGELKSVFLDTGTHTDLVNSLALLQPIPTLNLSCTGLSLTCLSRLPGLLFLGFSRRARVK